MVSLALFLAAFGPSSTRYGFPSGNSLTAPIDASATVTPVSCEDAFPPPHRAGLWASDLWNLSTPNAEEAQSSFSLGLSTPTCDVGRSLARGHSARPTRRTGPTAPALRVLRGRARSGGHYRVDKGLNAARKRARDTMAPLNNRTQLSTYPVGIRNSHS